MLCVSILPGTRFDEISLQICLTVPHISLSHEQTPYFTSEPVQSSHHASHHFRSHCLPSSPPCLRQGYSCAHCLPRRWEHGGRVRLRLYRRQLRLSSHQRLGDRIRGVKREHLRWQRHCCAWRLCSGFSFRLCLYVNSHFHMYLFFYLIIPVVSYFVVGA
jgi:hypothetical protein